MLVFQIVIFVAAWAFAAWRWYAKQLEEQRRVAEIAAYCEAQGWRFSADDPYDLLARWDGPPFDTGRRRRAGNVVAADLDGRAMVAFEYAYDMRIGKRTETFHYSVVALGMPCALPALHVAPEGAFTRIGTALGLEDIELESEDFNRRFRVRCPDPKLAHDVLTPRTMETLLSLGRVQLRFAGTDALCYREGRLDPVEVLGRVRALQTVLDGVPSFVWRDRGVVA